MPTEILLRDYQESSIQQLRVGIGRGAQNQILSLPTGSGKTVCAAYLIRQCYEKGKRAIFVCDRIALINQTSDTLDHYGIPHGVIQANHWRYRPYERIQIASAQTIARREWPDADLIIVDEAHGVQEIVKKRISPRKIPCIGLTATPFTKGLGKLYDGVITVITMNQLVEQKFLVPFRVFAASEPDMTGAKTVGGEWTDKEAETRSLPIVGDCMQEYLKHGQGKKFIAFGCTIAHCEALRQQFSAAGVQTELYTCRTSDAAREVIVQEFRKADSSIRGLVSVAALSKGFDVPDVECIIMARPLRKSLTEHLQILGRGLRPSEGKTECLVLDHAGNMLRFWQEMHDFFEHGLSELDDGKPKPKAVKNPKQKKPMKCNRCFHVHDPAPACPACGNVYEKIHFLTHLNGTLTELRGGRKTLKLQEQDPAQIYSELKWIAQARGWSAGRLAHNFRDIFGYFPNQYREVEPLPASRQVQNEVKRRLIAYHKAKERKSA